MKLSEIEFALHERDFAQRAASYGAFNSRDTALHAVRNLPDEEYRELAKGLDILIKRAMERTASRLAELGIEEDHKPPMLRSAFDTPQAKEEFLK